MYTDTISEKIVTLLFVDVLETAAEKDHPYFKMTLMFWAEDRAAWKSDIGTNWHWNLQAKAHIYVHNCVSIPPMHIRIYTCLSLHYGKMPHAHISVHYHVCSFDKLLGGGWVCRQYAWKRRMFCTVLFNVYLGLWASRVSGFRSQG